MRFVRRRRRLRNWQGSQTVFVLISIGYVAPFSGRYCVLPSYKFRVFFTREPRPLPLPAESPVSKHARAMTVAEGTPLLRPKAHASWSIYDWVKAAGASSRAHSILG